MANQSKPSAAAHDLAQFEEMLKAQRDKALKEADAQIEKAYAAAKAKGPSHPNAFAEAMKAQRDKVREEADAAIDKAIASAEAIANHKH